MSTAGGSPGVHTEPLGEAQAAAQRRAFPFLVAALVFVHACMATSRVTSSLFVLKQGYPEWTLGVLLSLYAVVPMLTALWAGRMADRHGLHRPVGIAVLMACVGALTAALSQHVLALCLAALLTGGALSIAAVGIQREGGLMAQGSGDMRRIFSWLALGPALSNALAPVVAGLLIDHISFRAAFALAVLLPSLAWWAALQVPRLAPSLPASPSSATRQGAWGLLRLASFRRLMILNVVLAAAWDAHSFVVPIVGHGRELSATSIGLILGAFATAATLVRLALTKWAEQVDEIRALRGAMAIACAVLALYAWLPGTPGLMAGSALLGLALGSVQPMVLSTLHQITPADRHGQALGLRMLFTNGATIVMPLGFGLLATASVAAAPMWLMAALLLWAQWPAARLAHQEAGTGSGTQRHG